MGKVSIIIYSDHYGKKELKKHTAIDAGDIVVKQITLHGPDEFGTVLEIRDKKTDTILLITRIKSHN